MSVKGGPGQGATLGLSIDTVLARLRTLQLPEWIAQEVDFTGLEELDWLCFLPANLQDPGTFVAEFYKDTEIAEPTVRLIQDATITLPIQTSTNTTPWSLIGSGFITSIARARAVIGEPLIDTVTFRFDGDVTPPAVTLETI